MNTERIILTETSKRRLESELYELRTVKRTEVTEQIRRARGYGDLSENFEYHEARKQQAILNGKIAEIEAVLEKALVVPDGEQTGDTVSIGSLVTVRDLDSEDEWDYAIVDATSADPMNDKISYSSPVGQALMRRRVGDVVEVEIPAGKARYEVVAINSQGGG
jgi:transcription elongation factor GreA